MDRIEIKWRPPSLMQLSSIIILGAMIVIYALLRNDPFMQCFWVPVGIALILSGILGFRKDDKPRVTITQTGITVREVGNTELSWQQIESARLEHIPRGGRFIVLDLRNGKTQRFLVEDLQMTSGTILRLIREHGVWAQ